MTGYTQLDPLKEDRVYMHVRQKVNDFTSQYKDGI